MNVRRLSRRLVRTLLVCALTLFVLETSLSLIDPFGMVYFQQLIFLQSYYVDGSGDYVLPPGDYHMKGWRATVQDDHTRRVPDSASGCKLLFVGDSLTFGWGVNDDQTFINLVARELDVQAINAGTIGYNAQQVAASLDAYADYDLGIFLLFVNDAHDPLPYGGNPPRTGEYHFQRLLFHQTDHPLTLLYAIYLLQPPSRHLQTSTGRFLAALNRIHASGKSLIFGFEDELTSLAQTSYPVQTIPWYTTTISLLDPHPDAAGHQQIAAAMQPAIREQMRANCAD